MNTDDPISKEDVNGALKTAAYGLVGKIPKDYLPWIKNYIHLVKAETDKVSGIRNAKETVRILNKLVAEGVDHVRAIEGAYEGNDEAISAALEEAAEYFGVTGYCTKLVDYNEHIYPQLVPKE